MQLVVFTALGTAALFGGAGRLNWVRGWICEGIYTVTSVVSRIFVQRLNPGLLEERENWRRKDTKPFDKVFFRLLLPLSLAQPILAGMDAVRFRWWPLPIWSIYPGIALYIIGMTLVTWTMAVNPHAETTVRIQSDRSHTVIRSGPYRIVRHPMYVGIILALPAAALMPGSMWALVPAVLMAILFIWRTALEDQTLRRELPGYEEYCEGTRYRLLPGLW